ncbi:SGNH/GDSL hydrolase family protein [Terrihalobacillus insolitus]|uniref:SGNH/GDSL hydrolase family protein n=1 Tax=Terrihalobacillus insolitus TaxID=2950438 RepID=UPI00234207F6|nr:SGNH/GDSL hydrolase family protein [Terrihalobacillus insolitus]MDC3414569.1 SGNH/GDSL hydrolase family protein [Terrihalobacillus insolitus]
MRKKQAIKMITASLLTIFIILVSINYLSSDTNSSDPNTSLRTKQNTPQNEQEAEQNETDSKEEQTENSEKQSLTDDIKDKVENIVDGAVGFFLKKNLDIVAIGDSLTQGVGDTTNNGGYVGILNSRLSTEKQDVNIENLGKRGNRSDQLLKRLDKQEIASSIKDAEIILVTIGANDIMKVVKENISDLEYEQFVKEQVDYKQRLREIVDKMLALNPDASIYLIGFYNPFANYFKDIEELGLIVDNWNKTDQSVADEYEQVTFIPTSDLFSSYNEEAVFYKDNFHPNYAGYQLMASRILEYIRPEIEDKSDG